MAANGKATGQVNGKAGISWKVLIPLMIAMVGGAYTLGATVHGFDKADIDKKIQEVRVIDKAQTEKLNAHDIRLSIIETSVETKLTEIEKKIDRLIEKQDR